MEDEGESSDDDLLGPTRQVCTLAPWYTFWGFLFLLFFVFFALFFFALGDRAVFGHYVLFYVVVATRIMSTMTFFQCFVSVVVVKSFTSNVVYGCIRVMICLYECVSCLDVKPSFLPKDTMSVMLIHPREIPGTNLWPQTAVGQRIPNELQTNEPPTYRVRKHKKKVIKRK